MATDSEVTARDVALRYMRRRYGKRIDASDNVLTVPFQRFIVTLQMTVPIRVKLDEQQDGEIDYMVHGIAHVIVVKEGKTFKVTRAPTKQDIDDFLYRRLKHLEPRVDLEASWARPKSSASQA